MPSGDTISSTPGDASKSVGVSWCVFANELFLEGPAGLDRVVVGGVRGQVHDADAVPTANRLNTWVVVRTEIVHDQDITEAQLGKQAGRQPTDEAITVRGREVGVEGDPSGTPNRAVEGQVLAPVHWYAFDELTTSLHPRVAPAHGRVHAGFIEKHQAIDRKAADPAAVGRSFRYDVWAQTLQRPSAFFLIT